MTTPGVTSAKTVVSLTPLALEADSRTLKSAMTYARLGYRSVVIEGKASRSPMPAGLEVISLSASGAAQGAPVLVPHAKLGFLGRVRAALRAGAGGPLGRCLAVWALRAELYAKYNRRVAKMLGPADLYHVHSYEMFDAAAAASRRWGGALLYDAHDFYQGITPPEKMTPFERTALYPMLRRLEARAVAQAGAVVTATSGTARLIEEEFGRPATILRNCHDTRLDEAGGATIRDHFGFTEDQTVLVVSGNYKAGMAVAELLDALMLLPDSLVLVFVGRGYERIRPLIDSHPAAKRVFTGVAVAPTRLVPFLRTADIGLVAYHPYSENYRYALPNGFFHVVAAHLPIVYPPLYEIVTALAGRSIGVPVEALVPEQIAAAVMECVQTSKNRKGAEPFSDLFWEQEEAVLLKTVSTLPGWVR